MAAHRSSTAYIPESDSVSYLLLEAQNRALELLAQDRPLSEVLSEILIAAEKASSNGMLASILLLSDDGKHLVHCAAPSLPMAYSRVVDGAEIGPAAGSCGTAAFTGKQVIVDDITTSPLWRDYRAIALAHGLRACWSIPILSAEGAVLGSFAMYYRESRLPSHLDSQIVTTVVRTAVVAIERSARIQRLRSSEERFRALTTCSPVGLAMIDLEGNCVYTNATCREMCGFSAEEANGTGWLDFLHPADAPRVIAEWKKAFACGGRHESECRWVHRSGEVRWTVVRTDAVRSEQGALLGYMASVADRTKRLVAEQKAKDLARELDAIVTTSPVGIVSFDFDRTVRSWNPMAERILGWRAEQIIGKALDVPESVSKQWSILKNRLLQNRSFTNVPSKLVHKDGREIDVLISGSPLVDSTGALTGFIGSIGDATELIHTRNELEQTVLTLRESEARFRALADNIDQFAWIADGKGWIFWYNQRWFEYTGTTLEEMQGWGWRKVHHPDHVDRVVRNIQRSWDTGAPWEDTFPLRGKNGSYRWFLSRAVPIRDESGDVVRWFGTNTDITDRIKADEALRRSEKLNVAGKLAASVAHELNNPLATVVNLVYLAREQSKDPAQRNLLSSAEYELQRISRFANRILSFQRGNTSRESVAIFDLIKEVALIFQPKCAAQEISLTLETKCLASVHGSKDELRQVLANLISNAIDAVGEHGQVIISMRPASRNHRTAVRLRIADNGRGIKKQDRSKLFEPFYTTKGSTGTGLGLWITKDVVHNHGGEISVHSRPGGAHRGTIVSIQLPVLSSADREPLKSVSSPVSSSQSGQAGLQSC